MPKGEEHPLKVCGSQQKTKTARGSPGWRTEGWSKMEVKSKSGFAGWPTGTIGKPALGSALGSQGPRHWHQPIQLPPL